MVKKKQDDEYIAQEGACAAIQRVQEFAREFSSGEEHIIAKVNGKELRLTDLITVLMSVVVTDEHLISVASGEPVPVSQLSEKEAKGILCIILREQRIEAALAQQIMGVVVSAIHGDDNSPPPGTKLH